MIEKTAYNLGRNDEEPNINLAIELCKTENLDGIKEIVNGLGNRKEQLANDCIKVLYEIGERNLELIADYVLDFIQLLKSKNNSISVFSELAKADKHYEKGNVVALRRLIRLLSTCNTNFMQIF